MSDKTLLDNDIRAYALRVPTGMYLALQALARREGRSVNSQIVWMLAEALAGQEGTASCPTTTHE